MDKLRKIIGQLNNKDFEQIESSLIENESKKFLTVLRSYRENIVSEEKLKKSIGSNEGSFNVLKSRLFDKIQELLVENNHIKETNPLTQYLYDYPRETSIAILHKLENIYIDNDIPQELINVYSIFKKIYFHSDKYYHYSKLYNKQIAYTVAFEKAEDLLFNFNKTLANYFFSRSDEDKELIYLFKREIESIYSLNQSHRFELIKNFILIQCQLFADIEVPDEEHTEDLIKRCEQIINSYPNDKQLKYYKLVVDYFWLEYYCKINQLKKTEKYLEIINKQNKTWLLYSNYCLAFKFLLTKPQLLYSLNKIKTLKNEQEEIYRDNYDFYTESALKYRKAIINIYSGDIDESINILYNLIDDISLHHFFHFEIELKLTLAYLCIKQNIYGAVDKLLKSLSRKINDSKNPGYPNALQFIFILNLLMDKSKKNVSKNKIQMAIQQFDFLNIGERKILSFLESEIKSLGNVNNLLLTV